jgi:hypothetical protein
VLVMAVLLVPLVCLISLKHYLIQVHILLNWSNAVTVTLFTLYRVSTGGHIFKIHWLLLTRRSGGGGQLWS